MEAGSTVNSVISVLESCKCEAFSVEMTGVYEISMKWIRGCDTKLPELSCLILNGTSWSKGSGLNFSHNDK